MKINYYGLAQWMYGFLSASIIVIAMRQRWLKRLCGLWLKGLFGITKVNGGGGGYDTIASVDTKRNQRTLHTSRIHCVLCGINNIHWHNINKDLEG